MQNKWNKILGYVALVNHVHLFLTDPHSPITKAFLGAPALNGSKPSQRLQSWETRRDIDDRGLEKRTPSDQIILPRSNSVFNIRGEG